MNNNNKRGQAALEFLMTYGWAILSAIIIIGALGSYFYFNQGGSSSIFVNAPFYGVASSATEGTVNLEIQNKGGETLSSVTVNITNGDCIADNSSFNGALSTAQIIALNCSGAVSDTTFSGDIEISYLRPGSSLPLISTGSVSAPVA
ncbi:MAG: hypothetical protein OEL87_02050 [Nanoarchaeota archaeon]|nr:hypothetical protein [Nanoarchaeota archaeon]